MMSCPSWKIISIFNLEFPLLIVGKMYSKNAVEKEIGDGQKNNMDL